MNWQSKTVLVTGAAGFIGSHLCEELTRRGSKVHAFVRYNSAGRAGWLDDSPLRDQMQIFTGDLRDRMTLRKAMAGCRYVFHLGALIAIPYSYEAVPSYIQTNVEGTVNVFLEAQHAGVERIMHSSTSEVYGSARYVPIDEAHPLHGQSPYSASKIGADKMAEAFYLSFGLPVVTVRPFNTFGPRQSTRAVIPTIITQCLEGGKIRLGSLAPTRDFNYVANTVEGFLAAAQAPNVLGEAINLGSGVEITIGDLVEKIRTLTNSRAEVEVEEQRLRPEGSEVDRLLADSSKAKRLLGWTARVGLDEGLTKAIQWFEQHRDRYRAGVYAV